MKRRWSVEDISDILSERFIGIGDSLNHTTATATTTTSDGGPSSRSAPIAAEQGQGQEVVKLLKIDVLITFDQYGISSHPNHISLYHGALYWSSTIVKSSFATSPLSIYTLTTTNIVRKYLSVFDLPLTIFYFAFPRWSNLWTDPDNGLSSPTITNTELEEQKQQKRREKMKERRLVFVNTPGQYRRAQQAMTQGHVSQMLWFRWFWIFLARYMVVNDLVLQSFSE